MRKGYSNTSDMGTNQRASETRAAMISTRACGRASELILIAFVNLLNPGKLPVALFYAENRSSLKQISIWETIPGALRFPGIRPDVVAAFSTGFSFQANVGNRHRFVQRLAHVIDGKCSDGNGCKRFHFNTSLGRCCRLGLEIDSVLDQ